MPAASFDCSKAPGVDETVICSDPLLRQADHDLGQAYLAARAANPDPTYRASLRTDEHSWILQRNAECQLTKYTIVTDDNRPAFVDCFLDEYAERIDDLKQMKLHPHADPKSISHPIRHSFLASSGNTGPAPVSLVFSSLQLPAGTKGTPLLAWRADGSLLLLTADAAGGGMLYVWLHGNLQPYAKVPQALRFVHICSLSDGGVVLLRPNGNTAGWVGTDKKFQQFLVAKLPAPAPQDCGTGGPSLHLGDDFGTVLNFGPHRLGITPVPRFVTLNSPSGSVTVLPQIRIDSRFHLTASYLPFVENFLLSADTSPAVLENSVERRWAKTNCLNYWEVSAKSGIAAPGCVPFGPYVGSDPVVLPSLGGTYLAAGGLGLYRIENGEALPVMAGDVSQASLSQDGCSIAFNLAQGAQSAGALIVFNACKNNATNAPTGTP